MKTTDLFTAEGYDMVVSVTQKSINDQIRHLANPDIGVLKTRFLLGMLRDKKTHKNVAVFYDSYDKVPKDENGDPSVVLINGQYMPSILIENSGTNVVLLMRFSQGTAWLRDPVSAELEAWDMKGWQYGISISLDLASVARSHIEAGKAVPERVAEKLTAFLSDGFAVSQLFVDFQSTDLANFDPVSTSVNKATEEAKQSFVFIMSSYIKVFKDDPDSNPFILGYAVSDSDPSKTKPDKDVPPSLKPVGQTFTVYKDPKNGDRSTVNFVINTEKGKNPGLGLGQHPTPGVLDSNWIGDSEQCDGKMVYSAFSCYETLILRPFYDAFSSHMKDTFTTAGDNNMPTPPAYEKAVSAAAAGGYHFEISNVTKGDHQYVNTYDVNVANSGTSSATIRFGGHIDYTKTMREARLCEAVNWVYCSTDWAIDITITEAKDKGGRPTVNVSNPEPRVTNPKYGKGSNTCADVWKVIDTVIEAIVSIIATIFGNQTMLRNLFEKLALDMLNPNAGVPNPVAFLGGLNTYINNAFLLPAGQVFFFKNPQFTPDGILSVQLTYKSETGAAEADSMTAAEQAVSPESIGRKARLVSEVCGPAGYKIIDEHRVRKVAIPDTGGVFKKLRAAHRITAPQSESLLAAPLVDNVELTPTAAAGNVPGGLKASVSSELMSNIQKAMPLSPSQTSFNVVKDSAGNPLIFAIGSDKGFRLLQSTSGKDPDGWSSTDLLGSFCGSGDGEFAHAVGLDVSQDLEGRISLAFALEKKNSTACAVFYASLLSNDLSKTDFSKLASLAVRIGGIDEKFVGRNVRLGSSDDGKQPLMAAVGDVGDERIWYQVTADSGDTAVPMTFPENLRVDNSGLLGLDMGFAFGQRANYFLYETGQTRSLMALSLADANMGSIAYDYSPGNDRLPEAYRQLQYNSVAVATSREDSENPSSDIYVGAATGLYRIPNGKASRMEQVTAAIKDVHQVRVATHGTSEITLWVSASPSHLYSIRGTRQTGGDDELSIKWGAPTLFAADALLVAPIRTVKPSSGGTHSNSTNELFTLDRSMTLTHHWEDPVSSAWRHRTARVAGSDYVTNFNSFTTQFRLVDKSGKPAGGKIKISSTEWQYCTINGAVYSLDRDVPAEVEVDPFGGVTIIGHAWDISPPVLCVTSDAFEETLNIHPNGKIHHHLHGVTDGAALLAARDQSGKPVLPQGTSPDIAHGVARTIAALNRSAEGQFAPSRDGHVFTAVERPGSDSSAKPGDHDLHNPSVSFQSLPDVLAVGLTSSDGSWAALDDAKAHELRVAAAAEVGIQSWASDVWGDIWHWLENCFHAAITVIRDGVVQLAEGVSFVLSKVGEGLQFLLTIGDKVLTFVLDTAAKVYKVVNFVLKAVGIDLDKILAWIGHQLGWDHIWATHKTIAAVTKNFLDYGVDEVTEFIESTRGTLRKESEELKRNIKNVILPAEVSSRTLSSYREEMDHDVGDKMNNSASINFANYHLLHTGPGDKDDTPELAALATAVGFSGSDNPIEQLYEDVLAPVARVLQEKLSQTGTDLGHLLEHGTVEDLQQVVADIVDLLISTLTEFVDGLLKFLEDLIKDLQRALTNPIDVPIFGALYKFACELAGDEEDMSVLNIIAFILAVPTTTVGKIFANTTPDQLDIDGDLSNPDLPKMLRDTLSSWGTYSEDVNVQANSSSQAPAISDIMLTSASKEKTTAAGGEKSGKDDPNRFKCPKAMRMLSHFQGLTSPICSVLAGAGGAATAFSTGGSGPSPGLLAISKKFQTIKSFLTVPIPKDGQPWQPYTARLASWAVSGTYAVCTENLPKPVQDGIGLFINVGALITSIYANVAEDADAWTWLASMHSSGGGTLVKLGYLIEQPECTIPGYFFAHAVGDVGAMGKAVRSLSKDEVFYAQNIGGTGT